MTILKEAFVDLQEKYDKVIKLVEEDSKLDPETEPYLSKYAARQILIGMKANIENLLRSQTVDSSEYIKLTAMLGAVQLHLGTIGIDTDEISTGEKHLEKCKEIIKKYEMLPQVIMITLNLYNQLGILWSQREPEKSKKYLEKSESFYMKFKENKENPIDISDLFRSNLESYNVELALKNYEKVHTLTLYYLAQIYGALKDALKSAVYCHITLQRQLDMGDYDPIDWALNAATLSQFFMEKCGFKQARHHLSASSYILNKYEKELEDIQEHDENYLARLEQFKHRSADVARCWAKYGLLLLAKSKERLLNHTDDITVNCSMSSDLTKLQLSPDSSVSSEDLLNLDFKGIDVTSFEEQVSDQFVLTLTDARKVFFNIQSWTCKAQEYYNLTNLASDYIEIVQDQSQMYLNLLFFDDNTENQAKLHKRRADLLENVLANVNPQYYLHYCRQIWFELAQIYADILDIKTEKLREIKERPKPQALLKVNNLVEKSISHYMNFINSFKEVENKELPAKFPNDAEKPLLQAYFHIAALYGRFITLDKEKQLRNTEMSLQYYELVTKYCERNSKAKELVSMELSICKEMVALLPIKVAKLKLETT